MLDKSLTKKKKKNCIIYGNILRDSVNFLVKIVLKSVMYFLRYVHKYKKKDLFFIIYKFPVDFPLIFFYTNFVQTITTITKKKKSIKLVDPFSSDNHKIM